jgi:hypothetical protein
MKKYVLKAALVFGAAFLLSANSQAQVSSELRNFYNANVVTNDTFDFWVNLGGAHAYNFNQYNISANQVTYKVRKTNLQLMSGAQSNFCLYHNNDPADPQSQCYIPTVTLTGTFVTGPGEYNTLLADFNAGSTTTGISVVRYTFFDVNNANDSVSIILRYHVTPVGINESMSATLGEPYPNPVSDNVSFAYSFSNENGGSATITDISGKVIYTEAVSSKEGVLHLETSAWAKGVYVISLENENGIVARRKMVVQ